MKGYIAVDCGKYNTKVDAYNPEKKKEQRFRYRTKVSEGTFEDDMFDRGTFIVQIDDGPIYKVGNDAKNEPSMETSKMSEIHQVCTMTAIAIAAGKMKTDEVIVAIGMPLQIAGIPEERIEYKNYILGEQDGMHKVKIKTECTKPPVEVAFKISGRYVYPEGIGVLYEYPAKVDGPTAIIDIGNLNTNNTYTDGFHVIAESCFTDELGGKVLISGLAQQLTSELRMRCDDNLAASTLLRPYDDRCLRSRNNDPLVEEKSREIIDNYLMDHVIAIKTKCDTRHWPLDFMNVICVGGTARLLAREIYEVFGENAFIPDNPEYVNVCGFLKRICADAGIDLTTTRAPKKEA